MKFIIQDTLLMKERRRKKSSVWRDSNQGPRGDEACCQPPCYTKTKLVLSPTADFAFWLFLVAPSRLEGTIVGEVRTEGSSSTYTRL